MSFRCEAVSPAGGQIGGAVMGRIFLWPAMLVVCSQFIVLASEELKPETEQEKVALQKYIGSIANSKTSAEEKERAAQFFLAVMKAKAVTEKFLASDSEMRKTIAEEKALSALPAKGPFVVLQTLVLDPDLQQLSAGRELPAENVVKAIFDCRSFKGRVLVGFGEPREYGLFEVRIGYKDHGFRVLDAKPAPAEQVALIVDNLREHEALKLWGRVLADGDDFCRTSVPGLAEMLGRAKFQVRKVSRLGTFTGGDNRELVRYRVSAERADSEGKKYKVFASKMRFVDLCGSILSVEADDEGQKDLEAKIAVCEFVSKFCQMIPADRRNCIAGDDGKIIAEAKGLALAGNLDPFQVDVLGDSEWRVQCTVESDEEFNFPVPSKKGVFRVDVSKQADGSYVMEHVDLVRAVRSGENSPPRP